MDRHFIALTYLEWLNWAARGVLRVSSERIIWASGDSEADAFRLGLRVAPDLEPADDAFLLAILERAPRHSRDGTSVDVLLEGVRFEALSERSHRLFEPTAVRMHLKLGDTTPALQQAWVLWKQDYVRRSAEQRARRLWAWAHGRAWPQTSSSSEAQLLLQIAELEAKIGDFRLQASEKMQWASGTDAGAWYEIVLCAKQEGALSTEENASWKAPVNDYLMQAQKRPQMSDRFFRVDDPRFATALIAFTQDRENVASLLAFASARHQAFRLSVGLAPNMLAFKDDLKDFAHFYSGAHESDIRRNGVSIALIALARALPDEGITTLIAGSGLKAGWADTLSPSETTIFSGDGNRSEASPAEFVRSIEKEIPPPGMATRTTEPQIATQDGTGEARMLSAEADVQLAQALRGSSLATGLSGKPAKKAAVVRKRAGAKPKPAPDGQLL